METKANYVLVGLFTLIAVVAAFVFVYWTATIGDRGETVLLRVRIPGSASGLGRGSAVLFNGVKVGDVQRVYIDVNDPTIAIADTLVDRLTPITKSTQADIGIAGLTGQANIELRGANLEEPKLLDEAEENGRVAEITANPSAVTNLLETAQDIFKRADSVLSNLEGFVGDVRQPLTTTVTNAEKFSQALADNSEGVDKFLASVTKLSDQLASASDKLDATLDAAEGLISSVDKEQVAKIVENVEVVTRNLRDTSGQLEGVVSRVDGAVQSVTAFADDARGTLGKVDGILDGVDPQALRNTIANVETVSKNANDVVAKVDRILQGVDPKSVENTMKNIEIVSNNATELTDQASKILKGVDPDAIRTTIGEIETASKSLNRTLGKADEIIAAVSPDSLRTTIANIESASKNADKVAGDVAKVTADVAARRPEIDKFIADASQLADRLNNASVRVDGILAKVDSLLGSDQTSGLVAEASETLKSFKQVADTLNSRLGTITDGLARFSNQGLREVEAFVRDGRRSIMRIEEAFSGLERNPQRIITGGDGTVREYDGRARR